MAWRPEKRFYIDAQAVNRDSKRTLLAGAYSLWWHRATTFFRVGWQATSANKT